MIWLFWFLIGVVLLAGLSLAGGYLYFKIEHDLTLKRCGCKDPPNTNPSRSPEFWEHIALMTKRTLELDQAIKKGITPSITRQQWLDQIEDDQQAEAEAKAQIIARLATENKRRQDEQEIIRADFPRWLIDFAYKYSLYSYRDIAALVDYITSILEYAQVEFSGCLPIRKAHEALELQVYNPAPNASCMTRLFFEQLSKVLATQDILTGGMYTGSRGKEIAPDAIKRLRPASSVQARLVQSGDAVVGHNSKIAQAA